MAKTRTVTGAGIVATTALVLIFGNQAFVEWVGNHTSGNSAWGWFLRVLAWPRWALGPVDDSSGAMRRLIADDLRALLLILIVAVILGVVTKSVVGGAGGFFLGWAALVFASALAAFITAFIVADPSLVGAFQVAGAGSAYGLFAGWIVGIATATAKRGD
ncbi:hypothetical protein F4553_007165 [Allocatelliglobosispora scoriae]|uniref:Uncharacterized protein n=1 Tax=Allocatelliglobosispora scoriae TaxID=643052 RepID=A0A841C4I3_9ACTN|nr:hypothetical protein [Allocatelliglobosispora scoriae]MBB5873731.1 hypothetical protein [Allocatelliglobosispora scoriae]